MLPRFLKSISIIKVPHEAQLWLACYTIPGASTVQWPCTYISPASLSFPSIATASYTADESPGQPENHHTRWVAGRLNILNNECLDIYKVPHCQIHMILVTVSPST